MAGITESRTYDSLLTTTLAHFEKSIEDQIFDDYPLVSWLNGRLGRALRGSTVKKMQRGGESIVVHVLYEQNSTVDSYAGAETLDTTLQEGHTIGRYNWKQYAGTIGITGLERRSNMGESAMINLLEAKTTQTIMTLKDRFNRDFYADGTGNGGKNFTGTQALISATTTVGGLAPGTFDWWKSTVDASGGSFAANGINKMRTTLNTVTFGNNKPDIIFTDQTTYERFEKTQEEKKRYASERAANVGFDNMLYKGVPAIFDRDCPSGFMYFLNSKFLNYYVHPDADLKPGPFMTPENQDVTTSKIIHQGNLTTNNRRRHAVISGFTD